MNLLEIVLIAIGMSLDIFGYAMCQSASYAKIDKRKLGFYSLAFAIWEFISLVLGFYSVELLLDTKITDPGSHELHLIAVIILIVMGVRMLLIGLKKDIIEERRRDDVSFWKLMHDNFLVGVRTYMVGFAFAACETNFGIELLVLMVIAIFMVILGLYIGYRYGFGIRNKVYFLSSTLLFFADISLGIKYLVG